MPHTYTADFDAANNNITFTRNGGEQVFAAIPLTQFTLKVKHSFALAALEPVQIIPVSSLFLAD